MLACFPFSSQESGLLDVGGCVSRTEQQQVSTNSQNLSVDIRMPGVVPVKVSLYSCDLKAGDTPIQHQRPLIHESASKSTCYVNWLRTWCPTANALYECLTTGLVCHSPKHVQPLMSCNGKLIHAHCCLFPFSSRIIICARLFLCRRVKMHILVSEACTNELSDTCLNS